MDITILQEQYKLLKGSREVAFNFIETEVGENLNVPVSAFDGSTIRYLLIHNYNTYLQWLSNFALGNSFDLLRDDDFKTINLIRPLYTETDKLIAKFLDQFAERLNVTINGTLSRNRKVAATPLELFTHVLTHEFHHKGQMMTMCRLLGHPAPDTDVIRF